MRLAYEVSKEKGGRYYVHPFGVPSDPVKGSHGEKKKAIRIAAKLCGMTAKEYIAIRKQEETNVSG
jgi:hypothetical protein